MLFGLSLFDLNFITATGTLLLEVVLLIDLFFIAWIRCTSAGKNFFNKCLNFFGLDNTRFINLVVAVIFILSLFSTVITLVYSEIYGIIPCGLCWLERVFMYSMTVLLGTAIIRRQQLLILPYAIVLAIFGFTIALYHHILQMTAVGTSHLPCPTSGGECSKIIIYEYSHITFPWMAVVVFGVVVAWGLFTLRVVVSKK